MMAKNGAARGRRCARAFIGSGPQPQGREAVQARLWGARRQGAV